MMQRTNVFSLLLAFCLTANGLAAPGKKVSTMPAAGQQLAQKEVDSKGEDAFFSVTAIPDSVFRKMQGRSWRADCTTKRSELRYLRCLHRDAGGDIRVGEMVLNRRIADKVLEILHELYRQRYPIECMRLIAEWEGDDERSMRDNNSSAFNFRFISHTRKVSKHGLGLAIDINPLYNPYLKTLPNGQRVIEPATATAYTDRKNPSPYLIRKGDLCYRLFTQAGFSWGGDWRSCKDYQHFEWPIR